MPVAPDRRATFDVDARRAFARLGWTVVPALVDPHSVRLARQAIERWLSEAYDPGARSCYEERSFAPSLRRAPAIMALVTETGLLDVASELVGGPLLTPTQGQIALRLPDPLGSAAPPTAHVDGVPDGDNGVPADGRMHGHTVLVGVLLSDVPATGYGNLTVWPGTHLELARRCRSRDLGLSDPAAFLDAVDRLAAETSEPCAVTGRAGDAVLLHSLLAHAAGPNTSSRIRNAVYFRLSTPDRAVLGPATLTDPWIDWPAMQHLVEVADRR
jgi:hypothetical protein